MVITVLALCGRVLSRSPEKMGSLPDGDARGFTSANHHITDREAACRSITLARLPFLTLAAGMSLGLFAQIGTIAHLYSLIVPALGTQPRRAPAEPVLPDRVVDRAPNKRHQTRQEAATPAHPPPCLVHEINRAARPPSANAVADSFTISVGQRS